MLRFVLTRRYFLRVAVSYCRDFLVCIKFYAAIAVRKLLQLAFILANPHCHNQKPVVTRLIQRTNVRVMIRKFVFITFILIVIIYDRERLVLI